MIDRLTTPGRGGATGDFERLYSEHHRAVLGYCTRRASRSDAWDAASEVFLVAWRRLDEIPPGDEARAWLLGVAYRILSNQRRGAKRRARLFERIAGVAAERPLWPEEQLIRSEASAEIIAALARLRPQDREILLLATWEELSPPEIAAVLGISRDAVDQRYSRAKRRLADQLDGNKTVSRLATQADSEKGGEA